jgi:hypothetical protein
VIVVGAHCREDQVIGELAILILSIVIGLPVVILGGRATRSLISRMDSISRISAWVGRVGLTVGILASLLICVGVSMGGNVYFAPLAGFGAAFLVELVVGSQLRNGIKAWERRERVLSSTAQKPILAQIEASLGAPGVSTVEGAALRFQRSVLRWLMLGTDR